MSCCGPVEYRGRPLWPLFWYLLYLFGRLRYIYRICFERQLVWPPYVSNSNMQQRETSTSNERYYTTRPLKTCCPLCGLAGTESLLLLRLWYFFTGYNIYQCHYCRYSIYQYSSAPKIYQFPNIYYLYTVEMPFFV